MSKNKKLKDLDIALLNILTDLEELRRTCEDFELFLLKVNTTLNPIITSRAILRAGYKDFRDFYSNK